MTGTNRVWHVARAGNKYFLCLEANCANCSMSTKSNRWQEKHFCKEGGIGGCPLSVLGVCLTDCDGWRLAQVSPSLLCLPCHILKMNWPKGCLTGGLAAIPVGTSDGRGWTGCSIFLSCAYYYCSYPLGFSATTSHLSNHSGTALSPPHTPQRGKWWLKRTHINKETQWPVWLILDVEEDRQEWWANDVLTNCVVEEVHHSRITGPHHQQTRKRRTGTEIEQGPHFSSSFTSETS